MIVIANLLDNLLDLVYNRTFLFERVAMQVKKCKDCKQTLPVTEFSMLKNNQYNTLASYCKACVRIRGRTSDLKKRYGITVDEFNEMIEKQENKCGLCEERLFSGRRTHVDHCHSSGKIRKLLCPNCNTGLGKFKDSPNLLRKAAAYLEEN